ncbi:MAG: DUF3365 domain-containing protein [bacterium]
MTQKAHLLMMTALISTVFSASFTEAQEMPLLETSRAVVQRFATALQVELQAALVEGGPQQAVSVCKEQAPKIASALSRETGAKVGRTSLQTRNAVNSPEPWQVEVLVRYFEPEVQATDKRVEYFSQSSGDIRYMQAIRTGGLCLTCHGQDLSTDLTEQLDRQYPFDRARGYTPGSLRGAFSVTWPQGLRQAQDVNKVR